MGLPVNENFWSVLPTFNHLTSLEVLFNEEDSNQFQLQALFDRASRLYSLIFNRDSDFEFTQFKLISQLIRRLDVMEYPRTHYFDSSECIALATSPLGVQCEVLLIGVKDRTTIIDLIKTMSNLGALSFQCEDDKWNDDDQSSKHNRQKLSCGYETDSWDDEQSLSSEKDELVQWLKDHLPSTCSITRDTRYNFKIGLWVGK